MKSQYEDKVVFVLTLLGIIFAITSFKAQFEKIILDFGFINVSLIALFNTSLVLILISVYLYSLDYVRYGIGFLEDLFIFKYIQNLAHAFYALAIFSPILYVVYWLFVKIIQLIPLPPVHISQFVNYTSFIISLGAVIISILSFLKHDKNTRTAQEERLDESASNLASEAKQLFKNQMWRASIIESYRSLEISIQKRLLEVGIDARRIPFIRSTDILVRHGIITNEEYNILGYVRGLRNKAVHSALEFTEEDAKSVIDAVDRITPKLETATTSSLLLEREALRLLVDSKKGLFLRHHFFSNADRDAPYDAWAEGPGYSYFIEIKATSRPSVIRHALDKLRNVPRPNKRIIIVMLKPSLEIELHEIDAKLLYFNPEKREFENRQELYDWIYK